MAKENKRYQHRQSVDSGGSQRHAILQQQLPGMREEYVGQILSNLNNEVIIHHLSRGVYLKTKENTLRLGLSSRRRYCGSHCPT